MADRRKARPSRSELASSAYPTQSEIDEAMRFLGQATGPQDIDYYSKRAEEHRVLGFESSEHRAANAHHLLASMYERLADREQT